MRGAGETKRRIVGSTMQERGRIHNRAVWCTRCPSRRRTCLAASRPQCAEGTGTGSAYRQGAFGRGDRGKPELMLRGAGGRGPVVPGWQPVPHTAYGRPRRRNVRHLVHGLELLPTRLFEVQLTRRSAAAPQPNDNSVRPWSDDVAFSLATLCPPARRGGSPPVRRPLGASVPGRRRTCASALRRHRARPGSSP